MTAEPRAGESADEDLRRIWEAHVSPGADDTGFLDRGGHSLAAVRVAAAVEERFGVALPLAGLMRDNLSLVRLREHVAGAGVERPAEAGSGPGRGRPACRVQPLTSAQRAVWTDEQLKDGSGSYAVVGALRVEAALDRDRLTAAVRRVFARHEALTAVLAPRPGHGGVPDAQMLAQQPTRPMRHRQRVRRRLQCRGDDRGVINGLRPARARLVLQPRHPQLGEPVAPLDHRRARDTHLTRGARGALAVRDRQHDPGPLHMTRPDRPRPGPPVQDDPVLVTDHQRLCRHASFSGTLTCKSTNDARH